MPSLSVQVQTVFAELVEQVEARELARTIACLRGSFVRKVVKGHHYWYFKTSVAGRGQVEIYLGADSPGLRRATAAYRVERPAEQERENRLLELCAMLRAGRASLLDHRSARVIRSLSEAGVFRVGGVLVGTQAFVVLGNVLGVRWSRAARTEDIDIATGAELPVAVPRDQPADIPAALESLEMGFLPFPGLDPRSPSTSFKVRGQGLRVDLLTPLRGREGRGPVEIPRLRAAAQPLRFLDYLLQQPIGTVAVDGGASWVQVPQPARFAAHKLLVASRRPAAGQTRAAKDLLQAAELVEVLHELRPGEVEQATTQLLASYPHTAKRIARSAGRLRESSGRDALLRKVSTEE